MWKTHTYHITVGFFFHIQTCENCNFEKHDILFHMCKIWNRHLYMYHFRYINSSFRYPCEKGEQPLILLCQRGMKENDNISQPRWWAILTASTQFWLENIFVLRNILLMVGLRISSILWTKFHNGYLFIFFFL